MKNQNRKFLFAGHIGNPKIRLEDCVQEADTCPFLDLCSARPPIKCNPDYENCRVYKFYTKYPNLKGGAENDRRIYTSS